MDTTTLARTPVKPVTTLVDSATPTSGIPRTALMSKRLPTGEISPVVNVTGMERTPLFKEVMVKIP